MPELTRSERAEMRKKLAQWLKLERKRLRLQRLAKSFQVLQQPLTEAFEAFVAANGGPEKCVVIANWRIYFDPQRESVAWKDHFILAKGDQGPEEAERITETQPVSDKLKIEPPPGALTKAA